MRRNYIVVSAPRTGSSYITSAIVKQLRCLEPNAFYGGEFFRWKEYFQLGQASGRAPGHFEDLVDRPFAHDEYDQSQPTGVANHLYISEGGRIVRDQRQTAWSEFAPISFRQCFKESQRRLAMLENSSYPWVFKLFPEHAECLDVYRLNQLINRPTTALIILYRSYLWDWFLSINAVTETGVYNERGSTWEKPAITSSEMSVDRIQSWFSKARAFINFVHSYRRWAEMVVPYESFSGDPVVDAGSITGINLWPPNMDHQAKLWTTQEKEQMISNLEQVKKWFSRYCKLLGYPSGTLHL